MPESEGVVLAFDYGIRFMGAALGELRSGLVRPLGSAECLTRQSRWSFIAQTVNDWSPRQLLVGLALDKDGSEQLTTRQCRNFAQDLRRHTQLPVTLIDERFTSLEADQRLRDRGVAQADRRQQEHAVAASLLIEDYFQLRPEERRRLATQGSPDTFPPSLPDEDPCTIHN